MQDTTQKVLWVNLEITTMDTIGTTHKILQRRTLDAHGTTVVLHFELSAQ